MDEKSEILAREVGKFVGGFPNNLGAEWVAKRLPNNSYEIMLRIGAKPQQTLDSVFLFLTRQAGLSKTVTPMNSQFCVLLLGQVSIT